MIEETKKELENQFPEYQFTIAKRIYGKCIVAHKSKYRGADIYVNENKITVQSCVPDKKARILIGGGALFLKIFKKDFSEAETEMIKYFKSINKHVRRRL